MRLLLTILCCCLLAGASIPLKDGKRFVITYSNQGKPVSKGTSVTVKVKWDTQVISKIIFDKLHVPTPDEGKKGQYTFEFKPDKTTRYRVETFFKSGQSAISRPLIVVIDENGKEMKEESFILKKGDDAIFNYSNERKPIHKGDSVIINFVWNPKTISDVIIKDVHTPTPEEIKNARFRLVVKPEKSITYKTSYKSVIYNIISNSSEKIVVIDENGFEI